MRVICGSCFAGEHMCGGDCDCELPRCRQAQQQRDADDDENQATLRMADYLAERRPR